MRAPRHAACSVPGSNRNAAQLGKVVMQRWRTCLGAIALGALLSGGAAAIGILDREGADPTQAPPDLAADDRNARGAARLGGEVGTGPEIAGVAPTLVPEPDTLALVSLGMLGLVFAGRRRIQAETRSR